jgi:hypothetical protein
MLVKAIPRVSEGLTPDEERIHASGQMKALSDLKWAIENHAEDMVELIDILLDGTRLHYFPTKGERAEARKRAG